MSARAVPGSQPSNRRMATTAPTITPVCKSIARQVSAWSEVIAPRPRHGLPQQRRHGRAGRHPDVPAGLLGR